jgi:hypothetical protein
MIRNQPPIINGVAYTHSDIIMTVGGLPIVEVISLEYSSPQTIQKNYSTGHRATSVGFGQVDDQATITISMTEFQKLVAIAPRGDVQNLDFFDIAINYLPEGSIPVRHRLISCRFMGPSVSSEQNSSQTEVELELMVAKISYRG